MFAKPPSRNASLGPCPGLGRTWFLRSQRVGGNMSAAPNAVNAAVPNAAANLPEQMSDSS